MPHYNHHIGNWTVPVKSQLCGPRILEKKDSKLMCRKKLLTQIITVIILSKEFNKNLNYITYTIYNILLYVMYLFTGLGETKWRKCQVQALSKLR